MNTQTDTQRIQHLERLVDSATGAISGFAHALSCKPDCESVMQAINDLKTRNRDLVSERNAAIAVERTWETTMMRVCGEDGPASVAEKFKALVAENAGLKSNLMFWDAEDPETPYEHPDEIAMECEMDYGTEFTVQVAAKMPNRVYRVISALEYSTEVEMVEGDEIETPATDAAIAALRAEAIRFAAYRLPDNGKYQDTIFVLADEVEEGLTEVKFPVTGKISQEGANHE